MLNETISNFVALNQHIFLFQNDYLVALTILVLTGVLAKLFQYLFANILQVFANKTKTKVDDIIFERTKKPIFYLILIFGLQIALEYLGWNGIITSIVQTLTAFVFIFIIARALDVVIDVWGIALAKKTKTDLDEILLPLFHKTSKILFVIIALLWGLNIWGIDITPYLAGAGILGIVLGMALQDIFKNIFGGVSIMIDGTVKVGDKIKLESGEVGQVMDITLRSTKIRTYDNEILNVPNGYMANSRIQNYTKPNSKIRSAVSFGVAYGTDVKKVQKTVLDSVKKIEGIMKDPAPAVIFTDMGDFALNFKAYIWVDDWRNAYSKKVEATEAIYNALNKARIDIPFPTSTVYMKK